MGLVKHPPEAGPARYAATATDHGGVAADGHRLDHHPKGAERGEVPADAVIGDGGTPAGRRAAQDQNRAAAHPDVPAHPHRRRQQGISRRVARSGRVEQGPGRDVEVAPDDDGAGLHVADTGNEYRVVGARRDVPAGAVILVAAPRRRGARRGCCRDQPEEAEHDDQAKPQRFHGLPPVQMNPDPCEGESHSYAQFWQSALPPSAISYSMECQQITGRTQTFTNL